MNAAPPRLTGHVYRVKDRLALVDAGSLRLGVDEKNHCATFVISTDDPDRVGDVVDARGIDLANFCKNPIAFYGHQQLQLLPLPIGKWEDKKGNCTIALEAHRALGTCYFSERSREGQQVFALVAEGILRATSIGFNPLVEPIPRTYRDDNPQSLQQGYRYPKVDLLEVSIVGIPAQPTATLVRQCLSRNKLAGWPIVPAIRKSLGALAEPAPAWSQGVDLSGDDPMSKRLGKTTPRGKATKPAPPLPAGCLTKLLEMIPDEEKDVLQDCVSAKIPKLIDEGYDQDQAAAIAYSVCREDRDKALAGTDGTAGGYTEPEEQQKAFPPAKKPPARGGQDQAPRDQPAADEQAEHQPSEGDTAETDTKDPRQVLNQLVDALQAYLDITAAKAPPEEDEEEEDDMPDQQTDREEGVGSERYEFRQTAPRRAKKGKYHPAGVIKRAKDVMAAAAGHCKDLAGMEEGSEWTGMHKAASLYHHKELTAACKDMDAAGGDEDERDAGGQGNAPADAEPGKPPVMKDEGGLDLDAILHELSPVKDRIALVGTTWDEMNGRMP